MKNIYLKKYWEEDHITFYLHFQNDEAVKQVEITPYGKTFLSIDNPINGESCLYDQNIEDLQIEEDDYISEEEFDTVWNTRHSGH